MQFPDSFFEDEIRNGFYISSVMKRVWAAQMEILEDVAKICDRHHIQWFSMFGTLLGAVRHEGYIPWDDDLDIAMLRDDYNRFLAAAKEELPDGCFIQPPKSRNGSARLFTSIWNGTEFPLENDRLKKYHGCPFLQGIDIFPFDYAAPTPEDEEVRISLVQIAWQLILDINEENQDTDEIQERLQQLEELLDVKLDSHTPIKDQLYTLVEGLFTLYTETESPNVIYMPGVWPFSEPFKLPASGFRNPVKLPFEGRLIPSPAAYDQLLKIMYGDYMECQRRGGFHDYPFFRDAEELLAGSSDADKLICKYRITAQDLEKSTAQAPGTPRDMLKQFIHLADGMHQQISLILASGNLDVAKQLLEIIQDYAIRIGTTLEQTARDTAAAIAILEEYCELAWKAHEMLSSSSSPDTNAIESSLNSLLGRLMDSLRPEIVFLPWKASHWEAMEPYWKTFASDPECMTYVIPIPWYYRNYDRSFGDMKCDKGLFPDHVPVTDFNSYDFKRRLPDMIFIQNPYDEYNASSSVHPFFYARNLRSYTKELIYIPWFKMDEVEPDDGKSIYNMHYHVSSPGVVFSDKVIVQSDKMRQAYIDFLIHCAGENTRAVWEKKISGPNPSFAL